MSFKKVENILKIKGISKTSLSKKLGIKQNTFTGWFCEEHQSKLLPYFWEIAKIFPDVNRDWLFFDEGEMLEKETSETAVTNEKICALKRECELLHSQLVDKNKIIALLEKRELDAQKNFTDTNNALGTGNAALLSHQGSEESQ